MTDTSSSLEISSLIDLALATPEVGVVNFNLLRALLHVIAEKLEIANSRVELSEILEDRTSSQQQNSAIPRVELWNTDVRQEKSTDEKLIVIENMRSATNEVYQISEIENMTQPCAEDVLYIRAKAGADDMPKTEENREVKTSESKKSVAKSEGTIEERTERTEIELENVRATIENIEKNLMVKISAISSHLENSNILAAENTLGNALATDTNQKFEELRNEIGNLKTALANKQDKLNEVESTANDSQSIEIKLSALNAQILDIEKEICELTMRFDQLQLEKSSENVASSMNLVDLHQELITVKTNIEDVMRNFENFNTERKIAKKEAETIQKSIDDLQNSKLDKDEIDELLAEKADYNMLERKVSLEQFDTSRRSVEKILVDALNRFQAQEINMKSEFDKFNELLSHKLDENELIPFKEYIEKKLQAINERISTLTTIKNDPEAAGSRLGKLRYLRNLNCISCDQHVMMKTEDLNMPTYKIAHAMKSLKPYLTYELDNLRKNIKDGTNSRNLHHFETLMSHEKEIRKEENLKTSQRYCGGSHTIVTKQNRLESGIGTAKTTGPMKPKPNAKCICRNPE